MRRLQCQQRGVALIIVLAFVVLLAGLTVAYLSQTTTDRQVAQTSFSEANADQIASSAVAIIVGDLRQEIIRGSASPAPMFGPSPTASPYYLYTPTSSNYMVPQRSGTPSSGAPIPNLVRRSVRTDSIATPGLPSRASAVNSATDPSANGRAVTLPRWNKHYLIPKLNTGDDQTDPVTSFVAPDWVMLTAEQGAAVLSDPKTDLNGNTVTTIGRYAYAIYDVGGLMDVNVAGYPTGTTLSQYGRKGSLAFADLTILPYPIPTPDKVDKLVGWRNYATTQPSNTYPGTTAQPFAKNFQTDTTPAINFYKFITTTTSGMLTVNANASYNSRTDQVFVNRQQLISYSQSGYDSSGAQLGGFTVNALQHLTTFSRQPTAPSWSPAIPDSTNPDFRKLRVSSAFIRNDGTVTTVGEPLVNNRFSLQRLNWLTYKGPSAARSFSDPDMTILTATFGMNATYLQKGTDLSQAGQTATTANIYKYFGLVWDSTNERWKYIGHPPGATSTSPLATSIATFGVGGTQGATREPDFFELLQAGILNSSLGTSVASDPALPITHQQSKMLHILTIGANLIAQSRADSYPVRIAFDSGSGIVMEAVGSTRLPYLNSLAACVVASTSGGINWLVVPNLWNPYRDTWNLLETSPVPQYPRPPAVRIRATGSVSFATVAAATPTPTPVPTPTPSPTP